MKSALRFFPFVQFALLAIASTAIAQTDLRISGANAGFPVAVPRLCDAGESGESAQTIADGIGKNLAFTGIFNVISPGSYVETPGSCISVEQVAYGDWSVIGAEGLVRGEIRSIGDGKYEVKMFLLDVLKKQPVMGKRYEFEGVSTQKVIDKFSNEIMRYFTGQPGVFGSRLAYVSRVGRFKELFTINLDGSGERQLTRDKALVMSPAWSPSADTILFTSYRARTPDLYFISAEGGNPTRVTQRDGVEIGAKYSPDGRSILLGSSNEGSTNLIQVDLRGKLLRQITRGGGISVSPSWSPDGSKIAFCSNRAGGPQIYVMDSAGGGAGKRISFANSNYCTSPAWSPLGDKIAFVCRSAGHQIFVSGPGGENLTQITHSGNNEDPNWAPDGRSLAYTTDAGRGGAKNIAVFSFLSGGSQQVTDARSENSQPAWSPIAD